jgi:hypothetical protein
VKAFLKLKRHRWVAVLAVVTAGLVATDFLTDLWVTYPLTASLLASALVVAVTVLILDEVLSNRDVRRWSFVAAKALEEIETMAARISVDVEQWAGGRVHERDLGATAGEGNLGRTMFRDPFTDELWRFYDDEVRAALADALREEHPWYQLLPLVEDLQQLHEDTLTKWGLDAVHDLFDKADPERHRLDPLDQLEREEAARAGRVALQRSGHH